MNDWRQVNSLNWTRLFLLKFINSQRSLTRIISSAASSSSSLLEDDKPQLITKKLIDHSQ